MDVTYEDDLNLNFAVKEQSYKTFSRYLTERFTKKIQSNMWAKSHNLPAEPYYMAITIYDNSDCDRIYFVWCGKTYVIRLWNVDTVEDNEGRNKIVGYAQCWYDKELDEEIDAMRQVETPQQV
jgi:hypothetical protein